MRHTGVDIGTQMQEDAIANLARQMELACSVAYTVHDATYTQRVKIQSCSWICYKSRETPKKLGYFHDLGI